MKLKSPHLVKPHTKVRLANLPTEVKGDFDDKAAMDASRGGVCRKLDRAAGRSCMRRSRRRC